VGHLVFHTMSLPDVILPVCFRSSTPKKKKYRTLWHKSSYVLGHGAFSSCDGAKYGVGKATIHKVVP
jgi:hypothetical protein